MRHLFSKEQDGCLQEKIKVSRDVRDPGQNHSGPSTQMMRQAYQMMYVCKASAAFLMFPPCLSSAGCHTQRAQWFQKQRNGSPRVQPPFNQVMVKWHASLSVQLDSGNVTNNSCFLLPPSSNLSGFTDRSRPPLTVLSCAVLALASTEGLKHWTVKWCPFLQRGHVFWNAWVSSMPRDAVVHPPYPL